MYSLQGQLAETAMGGMIVGRIGNPEWAKQSVYDDDFLNEDDELSPLDDDYVPEEYRDEEL